MKKLLSILLVFCMAIGMNALAAENAENGAPTNQEIPAQGEMPPRGGMPGSGRGGMQPPQGGGMPEGEPPAMPDGEAPVMPEGEVPAMPQGETPAGEGNIPQEADVAAIDARAERGQNGEAMENVGASEGQSANTQPTGMLGFLKTYFTPVVSVLLLIAAFVFVKFYKRKQY